MRRQIISACFAMAALGGVQSDAGTRRLEFEIEPIIMLSCVDQVRYNLDTARILTSNSGSASSVSANSQTGAQARLIEARFSAPEALRKSEELLVEIDIAAACSVRGLGRGEGFLVEVSTAKTGVLENKAGNGMIAVRDARGRPSFGNSFARRFTIPQRKIRLSEAIEIDVQLRLDAQYAAGSGEYSSPVDGVFSIEVTAP